MRNGTTDIPRKKSFVSPSPISPPLSGSRWDRFLARFSRVTSSGRFIPEIDGLRFVAIATVVLLHLGTHLKRALGLTDSPIAENTWLDFITRRGGTGVNVFFAISGFILSLPFALHFLKGTSRPRLGAYYLRRVTRLEPPYIVSMLGLFLVHVLFLHRSVAEMVPSLGASLIYCHNFIYGTYSKINGVAWTLEVEVQFYILAPLLALVFWIREPWIRRGLLVASILVTGIARCYFNDLIEDPKLNLSMSLVGQLWWFLVGFLFAEIYVSIWDCRPPRGSWGWDLGGTVAILVGFLVAYPDDIVMQTIGGWLGSPFATMVVQRVVPAFCTLVFFCGVFRGAALNRFFTRPVVATIGGMCYSIYLLHYALIALAIPLTLRLSNRVFPFLVDIDSGEKYMLQFGLQALLVLPLLLGVSGAFFVLIERPCMERDWPQRLWNWLRGRKMPSRTTIGLWMSATLLLLPLAGCRRPGASSSPPEASSAEASSAPAKAPTAAKVRLQLNWLPDAQFGGFYAARILGEYTREGLDVEIIAGGPGSQPIPRVAIGQIEFGVGNADQVLLARQEQADVVAVMASMQQSPRCLLVHASSGIDSFDDLTDITMSLGSGDAFVSFLQAKVPLTGVRIVAYSGNVAKFLQDPRYAQQGYVFSEPIVARRQGGDPRVLMLSDLGFNPYTGLVVTQSRRIASDPDLVRRFVRATAAGWRRYLEDPAETNAAMAKLNPDMDQASLGEALEAIRPLCLPAGMPAGELGRMVPERWEELARQLIEIKLLQGTPDQARGAFTTEFLPMQNAVESGAEIQE